MVDAQVGSPASLPSACRPGSTEHHLPAPPCRTLVSQLIKHERIETTVQKAKELRRLADQVVTLGKEVRRRGCSPAGLSACWSAAQPACTSAEPRL